jgi:hypothetical protein
LSKTTPNEDRLRMSLNIGLSPATQSFDGQTTCIVHPQSEAALHASGSHSMQCNGRPTE